MVVHGIVIAFFSLWFLESPKIAIEKPVIRIQKIILERKKAAPAKEQKAKFAKAFKPTAQHFRKRPDTSTIKPKPFPTNPEPFIKTVPVNQVSEKLNYFQKPDLKPIIPVSFIAHTAKPIIFESGKIAFIRKPALAQPRQMNVSQNFQTAKPVTIINAVTTFSRKPIAKPMQVASIPKGFINNLSDGKSQLFAKTTPGIENGSINSSGEDLNALRKGYSSQVWAKIVEAKFYPRTARRREMEGKPVVEFELRNDGQLMDYLIIQSSSSKILDKAAIDAIKNASPYPSIPERLKLKSIRFKLPISFILNEP